MSDEEDQDEIIAEIATLERRIIAAKSKLKTPINVGIPGSLSTPSTYHCEWAYSTMALASTIKADWRL